MKRWRQVILRLLIGLVFVWAGASKAWDPAAFAEAVEGYRLLPHTGVVFVALYLPWLEIICGAGLVAERFRSGSLVILSTLLMIFLAALSSAWWRGLDIECGCFSQTLSTSYVGSILLDLMLLSGLVLWLIQDLPKLNIDQSREHSPTK